jgi:hypothetical protein
MDIVVQVAIIGAVIIVINAVIIRNRKTLKRLEEKIDSHYYNNCENLRNVKSKVDLLYNRVVALDNTMNRFLRQHKNQKPKNQGYQGWKPR